MRDEFPETLCIEQGVVLSCRFAQWKVRRAPGVARMAGVSQSSVKLGKKRVFLVGTYGTFEKFEILSTTESLHTNSA